MRLAGYELEAEIGRGAQGVVYRARDAAGRAVAIKSYHAHRDGARGGGTSELARKAIGLRHPGLCPVHHVGQEAGRTFVVMEFQRGATLEEELRRLRAESDRVPPEPTSRPGPGLPRALGDRVPRALALVEDLARALHAAHEAGLVHGDLKPSNVMLGPDERPVLLDLGWEALGSGPSAAVATPAYAAPEQFAGARRTGPRSDVHGLGLLLHELVTLEHPMRAATQHETIERILRRDVRLARSWVQSLPAGFAAVVETALEKRPARRYPSALALAEDLRRLREGRPVAARRVGTARRGARWLARHPGTSVPAGVFALALLGLGGAGLLEARSQRRALVALEDATDDALLPELLALERDGDWRVLPADLPLLRRWIEEAQGVAERAQERRGAGAERLAELGAAIERMRARVADAETIAARTVEAHAARWRSTLEELADPLRSPRYDGLQLEPLVGLVPLGRDPDSGLFEFAHLQSGVPPVRSADGRLATGPETSVVLVLVPGGTFSMGSEVAGAAADALAHRSEAPRHAVALEPFLIAKHELTLGQWRRLGGEDPRGDPAECFPDEGEAHPARRLSATMAARHLARYGLLLPTEAQWEYAARAGSEGLWSWGADAGAAGEHANLRFGDPTGTRAVGSLRPNAFGLHDVHGNVMELVRDAYGSYALPVAGGAAERLGGNPDLRVGRGGAWGHVPSEARLAARFEAAPEFRSYQGCRPARGLRP